MVTLQRSTGAAHMANGAVPAELLAEFEVASQEGNERLAIERVSAAVAGLGLAEARLKRLQTAVGEATMNAMEHGSGYSADKPVTISVLADEAPCGCASPILGGAPAGARRGRGPRPRGQARGRCSGPAAGGCS